MAEIDTHALLEVIWSSMVAVVALSVTFALLLLGMVRCSETGREGRRAASVAFGLLALVSLIAFAGAVVYGLLTIVQK